MTKSKVSTAIGYTFIDLNVEVITYVPGRGVNETIQEFNLLANKSIQMSFNEEVAYTIAHGASLVGKRSAVIIKTHGLLKAANSVMDSLYTDISAGLVVVLVDDKSGKHSDNILEILPIVKGMALPYLTTDSNSIYETMTNAFLESEKKKIPFAVIIDSEIFNRNTTSERKENSKAMVPFLRDVISHVVHPIFAEYQYKKYKAKTLGGNPEQIVRPVLPNVPGDLPEIYKPTAKKYMPFFEVFQKIRGKIVSGDTSISSSFSFPPYNAIDIVTYIGGSIPLAIGAYLAGVKDVWALTGDFGFLSAGHMGLLEVFKRDLPIKIVIFNNKKAAATGGQVIQRKIISRILSGYEQFIIHITNPNDLIEISEALHEAKEATTMKIVLVNY